jgi:hypothetical protein
MLARLWNLEIGWTPSLTANCGKQRVGGESAHAIGLPKAWEFSRYLRRQKSSGEGLCNISQYCKSNCTHPHQNPFLYPGNEQKVKPGIFEFSDSPGQGFMPKI